MSSSKETLQPEPSLTTNEDLWNIPQEEILERLDVELPRHIAMVGDWLRKRPLLGMPYREHSVQLAERIVTASHRDVELVDITQTEIIEFISSVFGNEPIENQKAEFGDWFFSILTTHEIQNELEEFSYQLSDSTAFKQSGSVPERYRALFENPEAPAELSLLQATNLLRRNYGAIDGYDIAAFDVAFIDESGAHDSTEAQKSIGFALNTGFRYLTYKNWNLEEILDKTREKNDNNYPVEFFNSWAPFVIYNDSIRCLSLFRNYYPGGFPNHYQDDVEVKMHENTLWVIEPDGYEIRMLVKDKLSEISSDKDVPYKHRTEAELLHSKGMWNYQRIDVSASKVVVNELETSPNQF